MAKEHIIRQSPLPVVAEPPPAVGTGSVHYPESDGHFLPATSYQQDAIMDVRLALVHHFELVPNVVVRGDMFIYFEEGNPHRSVAPDVFVVLDHDLGKRQVYKLWEEGRTPDFALEVISPESRVRNEVDKRKLYEMLGVGEYFLFQPDPEQRGRRLVGYRQRRRRYEELAPEPDGGLLSETLGVEFRVEGPSLRLRSAESGTEYAWLKENPARFRAEVEARQKAEAKAAERRQAEARIAELETRLRQA